MRARIVVLISGGGTNLQALLDAAARGNIAAEIVLVVSDKREAFGLVRAARAGVETLFFPFGPYRKAGRTRGEYDADLAAAIAEHQPDLIVLAGWMRILSAAFLDQFPQRVINLHPALPGAFAGTAAIERAFAAFQRGEIAHSGCMVHYAVPEVDAGPVIVQREVAILPEDSLADFAARLHAAEHDAIVTAVQIMLGRKAA